MTAPATLREKLNTARRSRFVGRERELRQFRSILASEDSPVAVLFIHGPGGVGKSSLLDAFERIAGELAAPVTRVDARNIESSPAAFQNLINAVQAAPGRSVLMIDTYELLDALDDWIRESVIAELPDGCLVVLASRNPPAPGWRTDSGWASLTEVISLRNLRPDEAEGYLRARGVDAVRLEELVEISHGHPLALSLLADLERQTAGKAPISFRDNPDLVRVLLECFVRTIPQGTERMALELCAHTRVTTEELLREALDLDDATSLFNWLRGLSFIQEGPFGVFPHDLARDVLDADLRWRDLRRYTEVHARVRRPIVRRIRELRGIDQQQAASDLLYLHRNGPVMGKMHDWATLGAGRVEQATDQDLPGILAMVERFEGAESAAIARYWYGRQPEAFMAFRNSECRLLGFSAALRLSEPDEEGLSVDPAMVGMWRFIDQRRPLRPGEIALYGRLQIDASAYHQVSAGSNMFALRYCLEWITGDRLGWSFLSMSNPELWGPVFEYLNLMHAPEAGFTVGGRHYTVYGHDWRAEPADRWLEIMGEREIASEAPPPPSSGQSPVQVLSRPDFEQAVRQALKDYHRPQGLASNPLLRSRLVLDRNSGDPVESLRQLVMDAAESLNGSPNDEKLYRAINRTYLKPAPSQEQAAELLGLPFNTYRYHLSGGLRRITDELWKIELGERG
jgi:hypothetical protein